MEASTEGKTRNCVSCGRAIAWDANVCQYCGHDFRAPAAAPPHEKTVLSIVGGIMVLVVGIMGLAMGGLFFAIDISDLDTYGIGSISGFEDTIQNILYVCGAIFVILGLIAVVGGFFGVRRKHWGLAILGGVLGLFIITPYFVGSLVALVGIVLLAVSRKDFD
ncbi:MAG: hypothetical protein KJ672_06085 [Candidatus Thermoplasmatota archaeon]|nr:hypothetical protein [Candidatus Thermoplasmatota archaeon]